MVEDCSVPYLSCVFRLEHAAYSLRPKISFQAERAILNGNYRNRHCYAEKNGDQIKYYAKYGKNTVEIEKDVFDCLSESYSREWQLEKTERKHKRLSLDQINENIAEIDYHGTILKELTSPSAEYVFMEKINYKSRLLFLQHFRESMNGLSKEDRQVLMTFIGGAMKIGVAARTLGIAERTVYYRRNRLAEKLSVRLKGEYKE